MGQKQTCAAHQPMSTLPRKLCGATRNVRYGSQPDMCGALGYVGSGPEADRTAIAFRLAAVSVKRVVRTYRHIKTGWCSVHRVAHLGMATARNRHAADDGASNLWLCRSGSLRLTLVVRRRRAGWRQRKCKYNGRNNGYDCFHRDPLSISARQRRQRRYGSEPPLEVTNRSFVIGRCPLWVTSGHLQCKRACPLYPQ
jgi:hypothetical protein